MLELLASKPASALGLGVKTEPYSGRFGRRVIFDFFFFGSGGGGLVSLYMNSWSRFCHANSEKGVELVPRVCSRPLLNCTDLFQRDRSQVLSVRMVWKLPNMS